MLHRAATANAKVPADWLNSLCTRLLNVHKSPAVRMAGHGIDLDNLARQGAWNVNRAIGALGYSVAVLAEPVDQNSLSHAAPR
jgi:hypothetical protein